MNPRENDPLSPEACARFRELLAGDRLDELDPADALRLEAHLAECPACAHHFGGKGFGGKANLFDADAALEEGLDRWAAAARAPVAASDGGPARTLEGLRRKLGRGRALRRTLAASLAAAGLLVASAVGFWTRERLGAEERVIIRNLEVLEDIEEEGGPLADEIVNLLLEDLDGEKTEALEDPAVFDYILEAEIQEEL